MQTSIPYSGVRWNWNIGGRFAIFTPRLSLPLRLSLVTVAIGNQDISSISTGCSCFNLQDNILKFCEKVSRKISTWGAAPGGNLVRYATA